MAKRIEYFIDLQGGINKGLKADLAQMQQDVRDIGGELYKLSDTRVHVKMEFDKSYDDFVQKVQQLVDTHPILGVQFQYDINKKLLDQDIAEIANSNDLKHALVVRYKNIAQQIQASFKALSENPDDAKITNDLNAYIKQFQNIINLIDEVGEQVVSLQTNTAQVFKDDKDTIEGFAKHYNATLKQFNSSIKVFEKTDTGAARKEVEKYANELQSLMSVMDKIKDYGFSEKTRGKVDQYATSISSSVALPGVDQLSKYARQIEAIHNNLKAYVKDGANPDFREPHEFKSELDEIDKQILEHRVTIEAEIVPEKGSVEKLEEKLDKEKPKKKVTVGGKSGGGSGEGGGGTVIDGDATHVRALPTINNAAEYVAALQKQIDEAQATVRVKAASQQDGVKKVVRAVKQQPVGGQTEQLPPMAQRSANLFEEQLKRAQAFALALSNEIGESGKKSKFLDDSLVRILDHFKNLASTRTAIRDIFDQSKSAEAMEASAKRAKQFADSIQYAAGYAKNLGEMRTIMRDLNGAPQTQQITTAMDGASQGAQQFADQVETGLQTTISLADVTKRLVEYFERIQSMDLGRFYRNATATEDKIIDSVAYDVTSTRQQKYEIIPYRPDQSSAAEFVEIIEGQIHNSGDVDVSVHLKPDAAVVLINELQAQIDAATPVNVPVASQPESGTKLVSDVQAQVDATDGIKTVVKPKDDVGTTIVSTVQTQVDATDGIKLKIDENVIDYLERMQAYNDAFQKTQSDIPNVLNSTQEQFTNSKPLIIPIKAKESVASEIISKIRKQFSDAAPLIIPVKAKESTASDITRAIREKWTNKKPLFIDVKAKTDSLDTVNTQIREKIKDIPLSVKAAANTGEKLVREVNAQIAASDMRATIKVAPDQTSVTSFVNAVQKEIDAQKGTAKVSKAPRMLTAQQITKLTDQEGLLEKHRNIVTEVAEVEADALEKVKQSATDLNKEISSGIKELGASLKEIKRLEKEGKINAGSKPRKIDAGIQSQLDMIVGGVTSLRKDEWSDSLKGTYDQAVDSMNKLVDSYKDGTINLSQLKSAASDYTKTLKSQAKAEENAAKAAENKAKQEQSKATREQDKASTETKREQNGEISAGIKLLQEELKLRREIYNLELKQAGKREEEISATDKYAIDLRRQQADRMHAEANNIFDRFTLSPKQELDRSRIASEINDLEERIAADVAAKAEADAKKRVAKLGTVVATEIGNTRPEIQAALDSILSQHNGAKLLSPFDMSTGNAIAEWKDEDNIIQRVTLHYDENTKSIYLNNKAQREAETTLTRVGTSFRKMTDYFIRYITTYMTLQRVLSGIRQGFTYVKELDSALTELQLVTRKTDDEISAFADDAYNAADAVASTTTAITKSATEWARLGYTMEDSLALATNSAKLAKAGFMEVADATSELTSSLQAFYGGDIQQGLISAGDAAAEISDKLVYIGNNYAITAQGLGEGMQRSAAALVAAGNDINEAIALTTAGNIIQQDPNSVSNALKVVSMRLRGTNASGISAELGEEVDLVDTSFSKLYKTVKELTSVKENDFQGISILTDSGAYKSTYQILLEISEVWDKISDANQAALLEQLAGKTRGAVVTGILQNGKAMKSALADAQNAAGATDKAMETAMDSIEAKINQLQNAWQHVWQDILESDTVKTVIDMVTKLANALDGLISLLNKLPGNSNGLIALLAGGQSITGRIRHLGSGENTRYMGDAGGLAWSALQSLLGGKNNKETAFHDVNYAGLNWAAKDVQALSVLKTKAEQTEGAVFNVANALESIGRDSSEAIIEAEALGKTQDGLNGLITASTKASSSFSAFKSVLAGVAQTLGSMAIAYGISLAIQGVAKAIDLYAHAADRAIEKAQKFNEEVENQRKAYEDNSKLINELSERFTVLSKGVDENGNNVSLSTEEFEEYKRIVSQIVDKFPELAHGYDSVNGYIIEQTSFIDDARKAQEKYNEQLQETLTNSSNVRTRIEGAGATIHDAQNRLQGIVARNYSGIASESEVATDPAFGWEQALNDLYRRTNTGKSGNKTLNQWLAEQFSESLDTSDINNIVRNNWHNLAQLEDQIISLMEKDFTASFTNSNSGFDKSVKRLDELADATEALRVAVVEANSETASTLLDLAKSQVEWDKLTERQQQYIIDRANALGDAEKLTVESFWGSTRIEDTKAFQDAVEDIQNSSSIISSAVVTAYEESIDSLSKDLPVDEYWNQIDSAINDMFDQLSRLGMDEFETAADLGVYLQVYAKDEEGKVISNRDQLIKYIRSKLEGDFDFSSITQADLETMASYARELGTGEFARGNQMLYGGRVNQRVMGLESVHVQQYDDIASAVENYSDALKVVNETLVSNTQITEDQMNMIRQAVGAETDLSDAILTVEDSISGETTYVVKDVDALRKLVQTSKDLTSVSKNLERSQAAAQKRYLQLTKELSKAVRATDKYTDSNKKSISGILQQIDDVERLIDRYGLLEEQLLGTTNAFTRFSDAQELDAQNKYADAFSSMLNAYDTAQMTGFYGDYAVQEALKAIIPESMRNGKSQEEIIRLVDQRVDDLMRMGLVDTEDESFALSYANAENFFNLAQRSGVFNGTWEHYDLDESIGSIDDIVDKIAEANNGFQLSREYIVAIMEVMRRADINANSWISDLISDLDDKLLRSTEKNELALRDYYNLLNNPPTRDAFASDEEFEEAVSAYSASVADAKANADETEKALNDLTDGVHQNIQQIFEYEREVDNISDQLAVETDEAARDTLLAKQQQLLDNIADIQPSPIQIDYVLSDLDEQIDEEVKKANSIQHEIDAGAGTMSGDQLTELTTQLTDTQASIEALQTERNTIVAKWSEDVDEVKTAFDWLMEAEVDGVTLEVACNGRDAIKQIDEIQKRLEQLTAKDKVINLKIDDDALAGKSSTSDSLTERPSVSLSESLLAPTSELGWREAYHNAKPTADEVAEVSKEILDSAENMEEAVSLFKSAGIAASEISAIVAEEFGDDSTEYQQIQKMAIKANTLTDSVASARGDAQIEETTLNIYEELAIEIQNVIAKYQELQETVSEPIVSAEDIKEAEAIEALNRMADTAVELGNEEPTIRVNVDDVAASKALDDMMDTAVDLDSEDYRVHLGLDSDLWNTVSGRLKWLGNTLKSLVTGEYNIRVNAETSGGEGATAHVTGSFGNSYANGKANDLVGELGREMVVDPSTGRYYTVGDNGPEMVDLPANAIVFNAKQTKDLLQSGYTSTRGRALVSGNAYSTEQNTIRGSGKKKAGSPDTSSSAAEAETKEWYEAFEKAYQDLKKLRDDDVIDADEYYRRLQALYTDYYNKYGAASEENAEKLRDAWKQMYEDEKSDLEDQHNNNEIGTKQYLDRLRNLYKRFYKDIPGFAKEAARAQKEYLNTLKGEYEKLFSAAVSIIGNRIDAIQEEYDAAVEAVEKERDEVNKEFDRQIKAIDNQIKGYEKQIKAVEKQVKVYQKEIEAIQKDNEARQDAIDLQKAQYELARAQNQRTQHVYTSEKGFVYRANPQDVREAQNNLEDKQQELRIKTIQKEVDKLEEVIEGYNEKIDLLNEEKEHIQELKEASDEYYDSVLEGLKNTYEPMIKHFEEMQKMWQTFIDAEALAENIGVLETFGISVDDVLNTTSRDISVVKEKYQELLAALYADNPEMLSAFSQLYGVPLQDIAVNIDSLGTSLDGFGEHLTGMVTPWGETMEQLAHIPEELRQTVVDQAGQVFEEGQQPIDQYIKYILSFEEELRKMGGTIGDFWDESGKLREGINQEAFEVYVESWNKLNEAMQEAPGNMGQVSPLLQSIKESTLTPDQVMNYTNWLNEMNAGMPNAAESMGVMADNMASLSSADISGVTGKMGEMLADSNVTNALSLSQSLPGVADGVAAMDGKNLDGVVSLSDILSESNAANAATLGTNLGTVATGVNDISGTDLSNASTQMSTLAGNAQAMGDLATEISSVSSSIAGMNVSTETLNNFNAFVNEFQNKANAFKAQVQAIFGGGGGGEVGTDVNGEEGSTGGEGGSGGWFDGLIQQMEDLNAKTEDILNGGEGIKAKWEAFREEFSAIIGAGSFDADIGAVVTEGADGGDSIIGTIVAGGVIMQNELEHWLEMFTECLGGEGGGLVEVCNGIAETIKNMCDTIEEECSAATGMINAFVGAVNGLAGASGTAMVDARSGLHLYNPSLWTYNPFGQADGTAHADGTALAGGRWGLPSNQRGTLVGELGPETLIRNGRYTVIGATGPERLDLRKGDIILNHKQTEQVFKYGRATGRGKAYASGTSNNLDGLVKSSTPSFFDKFVNIVRDIGSDIKVMKPELHHIELAVAGAGAGVGGFGSTTTNTIENINVSLPNFNSSKADDLINDLQSLSLQAIQRFNRK